MADLVGLVIFLPIWALKAFLCFLDQKNISEISPLAFCLLFFLNQKLPLGPMCEPLMSFGDGRSMELIRNKIESDSEKNLN